MWPLCTANNLFWLLLPLLIGLFTGWWAWSGRGAADSQPYNGPVRRDPEPARPAPVRTPEPVRTAPVAEPVRPVSAPDPIPAAPAAAAATTAAGVPAAVGASDDLTRIVGIGPKLNELLQGLGVRRFDQIAGWTSGEVDKVDSHLGGFKGRIDRDSWVEQAKLLATGALEEWQRRFGGGASA
jgi:predicted flap endonuclease-1-like 5' DNA nuclease